MSKYQIDQEGTYLGVVSEPTYGWLGENKGNGSRYVCVPVQITEGTEKGKTINWYGNLGDDVGKDGKTKTERTIETLEYAFGIDWDWSNINWEGTPIEVVVSEYNGKLRAQYINPPDKPRASSAEIESKKAEAKAKAAEIAAELSASMPRRSSTKSTVAAPKTPAVAPKPASRALPPVKTVDDDGDEIPF